MSQVVWHFVALWLCEMPGAGLLSSESSSSSLSCQDKAEERLGFGMRMFAKFSRHELWGGYVDTSLTVEAPVAPQPNTRIIVP